MSLTNQTAFSPTDTMPLSLRIQCLAALITTAAIVARSANLIG